MRTTRAIYDSLSLSYRPFQSDGRACEHACKYGYLDFFFYVYVSRDDRMAVTKRGENCNREREIGEIGLFLSFGMTEYKKEKINVKFLFFFTID